MRRPESLSAYSVEVSSSAWRQLARLSLETYQRIREELEAAASRLRAPSPLSLPLKGSGGPTVTYSLVVDDYMVLYTVDMERRRLRLLEVAHVDSPHDL
jgi:mRNA-degrading endonuclease RelE of RelBE toxin-antitoxin system